MQKNQLLGNKFGRWEVMGEAPSRNGRGFWVCRCECGNTKEVSNTHLLNGSSKSCGCLQKQEASERAKRNLIGGYKNYSKYKDLHSILSNTTLVGDCMEWNGNTYKNGYAKVSKTKLFKSGLLHREVYRLHTNESPEVVMHVCDNRKCINPEHLKGGTQSENILDMFSKNRASKNQYGVKKV